MDENIFWQEFWKWLEIGIRGWMIWPLIIYLAYREGRRQ